MLRASLPNFPPYKIMSCKGRSYLKDKTGENFTSYITGFRLEKAKALLADKNFTIQEIGYKVGYNGPAYFIKQFKAKYGYTPNEFRATYNEI